MNIFILGMHRSGTSVLTGLITKMGAFCGDDEVMMKPQQDNPKGFFERQDVVEINDLILEGASATWDDVFSFNLSAISKGVRRIVEPRMNKVAEEMNSCPLSVIKDPRMCLTMSVWERYFPNAIYLYIYRSPLECARSLLHRNSIPEIHGVALWEYYAIHAANFLKGKDVCVVQYEELLNNPNKVVHDLQEYLSAKNIDSLSGIPGEILNDFVDKKLRHEIVNVKNEREFLNYNQNSLTRELRSGTAFSPSFSAKITISSLNVLESVSSEKQSQLTFIEEKKATQEKLKTLSDELDHVKEEHTSAVAERDHLQGLSHTRGEQLLKYHDELAHKNNQLRILTDEVKDLEAQSIQLHKNVSEQSQFIAGCETKIVEQKALNGRLQVDISEQSESLAKYEVKVAEQSESLAKYEVKVAELEKLNGQLQADVSEKAEELKVASQLVGSLRTTCSQLTHWCRELDEFVTAVFLTSRWRFGSYFGGILDLCTLRLGRADITKIYDEQVVSDYRRWLNSEQPQAGVLSSQDESFERGRYQNERLFSLLAILLKHPFRTAKKLNVRTCSIVLRYLCRLDMESLKNYISMHLETQSFQPIDSESAVPQLFEGEPTQRATLCGSANPLVSIIVPVFNQFDMTMSCLRSIEANTKDVEYEVILADDVSSDETVNILKYVDNLQALRNETNLGFVKNCNSAAQNARGRYLVFLNNDTNVTSGWLSGLLETYDLRQDVGVVGSKLIYPDGRLQEAGGIIWNDASGWNYGRLDDPKKAEYSFLRETDYVSGASLMIRRDLWEEIGGFDERYCPAYFEDADLCFEVRKRGYKVYLQPKSIVVHFEGVSHGTDELSGIKSSQVENKQRFYDKWQKVLSEEHFANGENVFLARDRSQGRKHILVIDHYVPHFDQDAGSRTMWQYLLLLVEEGYRVTFVGDNYFPHQPYTDLLERHGIEVLYGSHYQKHFVGWLKDHGEFIDSIYLLRQHIAKNYIDIVKKHTKSKIIYNGVDFNFLRMERESKLKNDKALLAEAKKTRKVEFDLFEKSDHVVTISEYEKQYLNEHLPEKKISVIPTFIYDQDLPLTKNSFNERDGLLFVGGFVHKPNYDAVKWFVNEIMPKIMKTIPNIRFTVVGSKAPDDILAMHDGQNVIVKGFVSDEKLMNLYNDSRVVVAPLTYGAGVKGKIIESIAFGIPIVTTPVGSEGIISCEKALSVANDAEQFAAEVVSLYTRQKNWQKQQRNQVSYAKKYLSRGSAIQVVKDIF